MHHSIFRFEGWAPCLGLALLLLLAAPASGGVFEGNGEIGFDVGWVDLDESDRDSEGRFSLRGGYHLNDWLQLEAQLIALGDDGPYGTETLGGAFINAVFNWHPTERIVPYALVGLGAVERSSFLDFRCHRGPDGTSRPARFPVLCPPGHPEHHRHDRYDESTALQLGVGSRFFFGKGRTAARVEASVLAFEDDFNRNREVLSLSVGLTWRLGKRKPAVVTVVGESP